LTARIEDTFNFLAVVNEQKYGAKGMQFLCDCKILHIGFLTRCETAIISLDEVWNDSRTRRGRMVLIGDGRDEVSFGEPIVIGIEVGDVTDDVGSGCVDVGGKKVGGTGAAVSAGSVPW
jgi:hypothetical protein